MNAAITKTTKEWREGKLVRHDIDGVPQTLTDEAQPKLGDQFAKLANPIARVIDKTLGTKISGCGGCSKMKERINAGMSLTEAMILRWRGK